MPYLPCPRCGHGYDNGRGGCPRCAVPRNEREAHAAILATLLNGGLAAIGSETRVRVSELLADPVAIPIRKPGEARDVAAPFAGGSPNLPPGHRRIGGQVFYSAAWLND